MFLLVWRKIINNAWKVICLLTGSILAVGMVCSIPVYANGILQRMLTKDLENAQATRMVYPGYMVIDSDFTYVDNQDVLRTAETLRGVMTGLIRTMPVPATMTVEINQLDSLYFRPDPDNEDKAMSIILGGVQDFASHVSISNGRLYQPRIVDGVIETVASAAALKNSGMVLDRVYDIFAARQETGEPAVLKIKIVGVYQATDNQDVYWCKNISYFDNTLLLDLDMLAGLGEIDSRLILQDQVLFAAFDYHGFAIQDMDMLTAAYRAGNTFESTNLRTSKFDSTFEGVMSGYADRESDLKLTLQILIVPILLMLIFYIFMVSQLLIRSETSMISVLESRGAGRRQILLLYGLESLILGLVALAAGPLLGFWMVRIIGASNGFLEFVSRKALQILFDGQVMLFGGIAVVLIILTTLLPVLLQSRISIVHQKQKRSRQTRAPFWQRFFLDLILIGISTYAYYRLNAQVMLQKTARTGASASGLDFLLFLASTLFILGVGLLFLRIYPWLLRLVYLAGSRFWNPSLYASFHQISRSSGQEQFLMIFLILALSVGLFNANAARTINQNAEDSIYCAVGSDVRLQEFWQPYDENGFPILTMPSSVDDMMEAAKPQDIVKYYEPDISRFGSLAGVAHAARVFRSDKTRIQIQSKLGDPVQLMAVDPYDFALTAWNREDLNNYHLNEYMNVMTSMPNAVILSANLRESLGLAVGDPIVYTVNNSDTAEGIIIAFIDYWPGYQPYQASARGNVTVNSMLIANLDFVLSKTSIQPYEVWLKRTGEASDKDVYAAIEDAGIVVQSIESANQQIAAAKNDPQLQGTNGALTLGFIVSMLICAIGFLIYWIMSIQGRVLQFGVFRAMGMGRGPLIGMLVSEQVLVSGTAIGFGILLGNLSSRLFVPLFQLVYSSADQPLPFRVIALASDSQKILMILAVLLAVCFAILIRLILHIRIVQAVKLGEE